MNIKGQIFSQRRQGFSLMEVNVALLLVAVGLMGLLSLFPVGLRQSTLATSDTAQAAFVDQVFNAMRANASTVTNWSDWSDDTIFASSVLPHSGSLALNVPGNGSTTCIAVGGLEITDYLIKGNYIKYTITIGGLSGRIRQVQMQVTDRPQTSTANSPIYVTDFVYMGM